MTATTSTLSSLTPLEGTMQIMVGNGDLLPVTHVGEGSLPTSFGSLPLKDVLVAPHLKKNLLSVSKLTADYPCYFVFNNDGFLVKNAKTNQLLLSGNTDGGLYTLRPRLQLLSFPLGIKQHLQKSGTEDSAIQTPRCCVIFTISN